MLENNLKQPKQFYIDQINLLCEPLKNQFNKTQKKSYARELTESFDDYLFKIENEVLSTIEIYRICKKSLGI